VVRPEEDSAGQEEREHSGGEGERPVQADLYVREVCHGGQDDKQTCCSGNEQPIEERPAGGGGFVCAAFHAGTDVFVFDAIALPFSLCGILPGRMLALGRGRERDSPLLPEPSVAIPRLPASRPRGCRLAIHEKPGCPTAPQS